MPGCALTAPVPRGGSDDDASSLAEDLPLRRGLGADEWPELPPIGRYDAGSDGWIEVRTCVCGRSLATADADLGLEGGAEPPASDRVARTAVCP